MDIQLPQILFQMVNFSVVLGAVVYLLYKPVQKILDERAQRVAESQNEVERITKEKQDFEALKTKTKLELEKKAVEFLENAQQTAAQKEQELIKQTKTTLQANLKTAEARWREEKKQLMINSKTEMVAAVIQVSKLVLGKKLDSQTDRKFIEEGLKEALKNI